METVVWSFSWCGFATAWLIASPSSSQMGVCVCGPAYLREPTATISTLWSLMHEMWQQGQTGGVVICTERLEMFAPSHARVALCLHNVFSPKLTAEWLGNNVWQVGAAVAESSANIYLKKNDFTKITVTKTTNRKACTFLAHQKDDALPGVSRFFVSNFLIAEKTSDSAEMGAESLIRESHFTANTHYSSFNGLFQLLLVLYQKGFIQSDWTLSHSISN